MSNLLTLAEVLRRYAMNVLEYYLSDKKDPSLLSFKEVPALDLKILQAKSIYFPEGKTLAFNADRSLLWGGARRISEDGRWLEFASLSGCLRVSAEHVDLDGPVELFFVKGEALFQCSYLFKRSWEGYGPDGAIKMNAEKDSEGMRRPLVNMRTIKGESSKYKECLVWLPLAPSKIEKKNEGVVLWSQGESYFVDGPQARAINEGWAKWVLPNSMGFFEVHAV